MIEFGFYEIFNVQDCPCRREFFMHDFWLIDVHCNISIN